MSNVVVIGTQWGDEGKGKIVDWLSEKANLVVRFQGGHNAGHTLVVDKKIFKLSLLPSGIVRDNTIVLIGNGVVIDPIIFKSELNELKKFKIDYRKNLYISNKAHLILPTHRLLDIASEKSKGKSKIGSTLKGIGPTYMDKTGRNGLRVGDIFMSNWEKKYKKIKKTHLKILEFYDLKIDFNLIKLEKDFFESIKSIKELNVIESEDFLFNAIQSGKKILAEGAQGSLLDIDFGTYPFVTSSTTTAAGACTGLGIPPRSIKNVFGIFKAYTTRVGSGPFPTELFDDFGKKISKIGNEFGSTTGRSRRCGWLDLVALKYSIRINGVSQLMIMKGDVLSGFDHIKVCTGYKTKNGVISHFPFSISDDEIKPDYIKIDGWKEDLTKMKNENNLPLNFKKYINFLEKELKVPIKIISVGPDREQTILRI